MIVKRASPMSHNISAIMSQRDTDRTPEAQAAREAGLNFET